MSDSHAQKALFEHRFWLPVLADHARFFMDSLAPEEQAEIQQAHYFLDVFERLHRRAKEPPKGRALLGLAQEARAYAVQFRAYKLHLLRRQLEGQLKMGLPPTFVNHTVNELDEYLRILDALVLEQDPPLCHPVHHHLVWLLDTAGHAATIACELDPVEKVLKEKSASFTKTFEAFYMKAVEMAGYLRSRLDQFPALSRFHRQVELEVQLFQNFLHELEDLRLDAAALGTLTPLMADHMGREACYYLHKLSESAAAERPDCDPGQSRF